MQNIEFLNPEFLKVLIVLNLFVILSQGVIVLIGLRKNYLLHRGNKSMDAVEKAMRAPLSTKRRRR